MKNSLASNSPDSAVNLQLTHVSQDLQKLLFLVKWHKSAISVTFVWPSCEKTFVEF